MSVSMRRRQLQAQDREERRLQKNAWANVPRRAQEQRGYRAERDREATA